jgi:ATP-binding cassette, subfamily A (ABC1), member 3
MGGGLATFILSLIGLLDDSGNFQRISNIISWVLRFTPTFCLGKGLLFVVNLDFFKLLGNSPNPNISVWDPLILRYEVIFLILQTVLYTTLAIFLDMWSTNPNCMSFFGFLSLNWVFVSDKGPDITTAQEEDDDVVIEQERVLSGGANDDLIVISEMTKIYSNGKIAVRNMSLGIPHGECFGLLGINGEF